MQMLHEHSRPFWCTSIRSQFMSLRTHRWTVRVPREDVGAAMKKHTSSHCAETSEGEINRKQRHRKPRETGTTAVSSNTDDENTLDFWRLIIISIVKTLELSGDNEKYKVGRVIRQVSQLPSPSPTPVKSHIEQSVVCLSRHAWNPACTTKEEEVEIMKYRNVWEKGKLQKHGLSNWNTKNYGEVTEREARERNCKTVSNWNRFFFFVLFCFSPSGFQENRKYREEHETLNTQKLLHGPQDVAPTRRTANKLTSFLDG